MDNTALESVDADWGRFDDPPPLAASGTAAPAKQSLVFFDAEDTRAPASGSDSAHLVVNGGPPYPTETVSGCPQVFQSYLALGSMIAGHLDAILSLW